MPSDGDRARALLAYANYAKVATALLVSRAAVAGWAKGRNVTPFRLRQLEQLLRPDLQIEEAPPPTWAAELKATVDAIYQRQETVATSVATSASQKLIEALADPERLAWAERIAEGIRAASGTQSDEATDDPPASGAPGAAGPGGRGLGSSHARAEPE